LRFSTPLLFSGILFCLAFFSCDTKIDEPNLVDSTPVITEEFQAGLAFFQELEAQSDLQNSSLKGPIFSYEEVDSTRQRTTVLRFDTSWNITHEEIQYENGNTYLPAADLTKKWSHDSNKLPSRCETIFENEMTHFETFTYNFEKKEKQIERYSKDSLLLSTTVLTFNADGTILKKSENDILGSATVTYYEYDQELQVVDEFQLDTKLKDTLYHFQFEYHYDSLGNWIEQTIMGEDVIERKFRTYVYQKAP